MKIKSLLITVVLATVILCSAGFVKAQVVDNSALIAQLQAQIQALMQQIASLQAQQNTTQAWCHTFTNYLVASSTNAEVSQLQTALTKEGFDASGDASGAFGDNTAAAVVQLQGKYQIRQTGTVGPLTRAKLNSLYGCTTTQSNCISEGASYGAGDKQCCSGLVFVTDSGSGTIRTCKKPTTCTPNWTCGWGPCINGYQGQVAVDSNNCGVSSSTSTSTSIACPTLARVCTASTNLPPVISGVSGPTTLNVSQTGTWTISASDPENGTLSYSVIWGDEPTYPTMAAANSTGYGNYAQTTTFTHSYSGPGNYAAIFYVKDDAGNIAKSSISVNVSGTGCSITNCFVDNCPGQHLPDKNGCVNCSSPCPSAQPSITVVSPNGGETYTRNSNNIASITVKWKAANVSSTQRIDVIRLRGYPNGQEYNLANNVLVSDGQEVVGVPSSVPDGPYTMEIKGYAGDVLLFDASDSYFKIVSSVSQCKVDTDCPSMCPACAVGANTTCGQCINYKCLEGKCVAQTQPPADECQTEKDCQDKYKSCNIVCVTMNDGHKQCEGTGLLLPGQSPLVWPNCTCTPNWTCGWGPCTNGTQSQIPIDSNNCGLSSSSASIACPALARTCQACITDASCPQLGVACSPTYCPANKCVNGACTIVNTNPQTCIVEGASGTRLSTASNNCCAGLQEQDVSMTNSIPGSILYNCITPSSGKATSMLFQNQSLASISDALNQIAKEMQSLMGH